MNAWLLVLVALAMLGLGGLFYDLVHRGRQIKQGLSNLVTGLRRVGGEMGALADKLDPPPEPAIMPRIMPAPPLPAAEVGAAQDAPRSVSGPNGHRPKSRGKKGRRRR